MATVDQPSNTSRRERRGASANAMQGKRGATEAAEDIGQKMVEAKGQARKNQAASKGDGEGGPSAQERRMQLFGVLRAVLVRTPADSRGKVEGTPFTQTGVERLMKTLKSRSEDKSVPGARVASGLLKFIAAESGEDAVHGASVAKLQKLAERQQKMRGQMGGAKN